MLQEQVVNPRLVLLLTLAAWGVGEFLPVAQAGNAPNPPPVPEEAKKVAAAVKVMPGLKAELFALEPMMANPLAFCIDEKGRVWVSESGRYGGTPERPADDLNSRTVMERIGKHYRDNRNPTEFNATQERIRLLEDLNGDGRARCDPFSL